MTKRALTVALIAGAALAAYALAQPPAAPGAQADGSARDAATQFAMGEALRLGRGVPVDRDAAIGWYRKAAAQGHVGAQDALGIMLFTKGERKQAIPLLQAAAQRGDARALYILGTAHFNGDAVPRDYPRAYAEMKRAAASGMPEAQRNLAKMEAYLTPDDRAQAVAILAGRDVPIRPPSPVVVAPPVSPSVVTAPPPVSPTVLSAPVSTPKVAPVPARPTAAPIPASGTWRVQLGAYGTATRAENQWAILAGRVPEIAKLHHMVAQAGDFWRLQADGLADRATADGLCRRVTAAGGACFAVAP